MFSKRFRPTKSVEQVRLWLETKDDLDEDGSPVHIAEWHNGREIGYVIMSHDAEYVQLNIAFFEHRNSDNICAVKWTQTTMNPPTIDTADFGGCVYTTKWDVSHEVSYNESKQMADWIFEQLYDHWKI